MNWLHTKFNRLKENVGNMGAFVLAYSGGVDSTFLLKVGYDVLNKNVLAVTAKSRIHPDAELRGATAFAKSVGARHKIIRTDEMSDYNFVSNPPNRCYFCKKELFTKLTDIAKKKI